MPSKHSISSHFRDREGIHHLRAFAVLKVVTESQTRWGGGTSWWTDISSATPSADQEPGKTAGRSGKLLQPPSYLLSPKLVTSDSADQ